MKPYYEIGTDAWIASYKFDPAKENCINLPNAWQWHISSDKTGYLADPEGRLCVGYDLNNETIRFGADGEIKAPGLNLWIIQEMGEKFAKENFMDDKTIKTYNEYAKMRSDERKDYERRIRGEMTGLIQIELKEGRWTAHVDTEAVKAMTGIESEPELSREQGIALFNKMSEARQVMPLKDPMGYMILDNNTYNYIKDQYQFQYEDTIQNIESGFINGNGHGCDAILNDLNATVRSNIRRYCLPEDINYQYLRHVEATPEIKSTVNNFVKQRVTQTVNYEKKRSHSKESLETDREKFMAAGEKLREVIGNAALPPIDISLNENNQIGIS